MGVGPTVDDLVTALEAVPGYALNSSTDVTISGFTGTLLDIEWGDPPCAEGVEAQLTLSQPGDVIRPHPGATDGVTRWYILDVDGDRLLIGTFAAPTATDQRVEDIQSIVDSTLIE
jgi:hypothetical protein